jgi:gas vesicle protein
MVEQRDEREGHAVAFVVGALLGGAAGAAWTFFNAPRSGAETRAAIVRTVTTLVTEARETVRATGERVADRLALAIDALAGGERADQPVSPVSETATVAAPSSGGATAAGPAVAVNGQAAASEVLAETVGEPMPAVAAAGEAVLALDPSDVEQVAVSAPVGTTS